MRRVTVVTSESVSSPELRTEMLIANDITLGGLPLLEALDRRRLAEDSMRESKEVSATLVLDGIAEEVMQKMQAKIAVLKLEIVAQATREAQLERRVAALENTEKS